MVEHAVSDRGTEKPQKDPIQLEYFRPIESFAQLSSGMDPNSLEFAQLREKLEQQPGFMCISPAELTQLASLFDNRINITGFSGQGVHPGQEALLKQALRAIVEDMGWDRQHSMMISGGTPIGIPHVAISYLQGELGYTSVGIMAFPGIPYGLTPGYTVICADPSWKNWGDETETMGKIANRTIVAGGGTQALRDALIALRDDEPIAVIANSYSMQGKIEFELNGKRGDVIISNLPAQEYSPMIDLKDLRERVATQLQKNGVSELELETLRVTSLPVSGLVTEVKNGERRACSQDLVYFAITGNGNLLPEEFRPNTLDATETLREKLVKQLSIYYMLDDPYEGLSNSGVAKLNHALELKHLPILDRIIDHAVEHDVHNSKTGHFGPACLNATSPQELAGVLKSALRERLQKLAA